jgi:amino acid transporter
MAESEPGKYTAGILKRFWFVPDLAVVVFLFLYLVFMNVAPGSYIGGLHNDWVRATKVDFGYACMLMPFALICMIFVAVRMEVSWPRRIHARKRLLLWRLVVGGGLVAGVVVFFSPLRPGGFVMYTLGFREYVRQHVDVPVIRTWLDGLDPNVCTGESVRLNEISESERSRWPTAVMSLNPERLRLKRDSSGRPMVRLAWFGFDAVWGVTIGSEEMEIPPTVPRHKVKVGARMMDEDDEYRLAVEPGVYVWHRM